MRAGNCRLISELNKYPEDFKQLDWPAILNDPKSLIDKAYQVKSFQAGNRVTFPIQDEPFLRSVGVDLIYDWRLGIRIASQEMDLQARMNSLFQLTIDHQILQPLKQTIQTLAKNQEEILLEVSGIMTIMNAFLSFEEIVLMARKNPHIFNKICGRVKENLIYYLSEVMTWGISYIYFADAVSGLDIIGPRFFLKYLGPHFVDIFEQVSGLSSTHFLLCPRTFQCMQLLDRLEEAQDGNFHSSACSAFALEVPVGTAYKLRK